MTMVKRMGERAAKSSIPILITGESGVGKEVIARAVHGGSDRAGKPFVAVNCGRDRAAAPNRRGAVSCGAARIFSSVCDIWKRLASPVSES